MYGHIWVFVWASTCTDVFVYTCSVEARTQPWLSSSGTTPPFFHWPGTHQLITCQAGEPQGPSCLYLPSAAITSTCCYSGILCDLGDSAGSKACKANTSPTDYFPQSTIDSNFFSSQYWELNLWLCACWAIACPLNSISALYVSPEERFVSWLLR